MVAGEWSHLAGERRAAVGKEQLGLARATRMEQQIAPRRVAGRVLAGDREVQIAQGNPGRLAPPAGLDQPMREWKEGPKRGARQGRRLLLESRRESKVADHDQDLSCVLAAGPGCRH